MSATKHAQQIKEDSQAYITTALFQLLETKDLGEITVTALVKRAGVSRMAFYRNFETTADVILKYFASKINQVFDDVINQVPTEEKLTEIDHFFETLSHELKLAVDRHYEYLIQQLFNDGMRRYYDQNQVWQQLPKTQQRYWIAFMSAGVYAIWREWLLNRESENLMAIHDIVGKFQSSTMLALKESN
ncbi:transcription regulator [Secundilactobacillus odoratitofui DSM 19909 = JCM 15043]|uniref:Transcription regulator n=1 Tax=Secundilactobacillus odoratitofui DSM 19909 = JCM 15043 TaxID=1423776 RepID=A0A0R1M200_9LACO|nr:TetR/AcrR family transcriptional regulator [Secundilactobacillus odoratitofui]KRK98602.1 transcription regulator [Secundilactobacillus odoratitofui DSM 19909 = JCM 15043]